MCVFEINQETYYKGKLTALGMWSLTANDHKMIIKDAHTIHYTSHPYFFTIWEVEVGWNFKHSPTEQRGPTWDP